MSIRAYRINKIDFQKSETFNLWHDKALVEFLNSRINLYASLDENGCGIVEIPIEILEKAVKALTLEPLTREQIEKDIEWAKARGRDYIDYYFI